MKKGSIRNLYEQRGRWYYAKQVKGSRPFIALDTADEVQAIAMVRNLERSPILLNLAAGLKGEVEQFVIYKTGRRDYSRNSGETKVFVLRELAAAFPNESAATITPQQIEKFYGALRKRVSESTAESYMMTLSSFFRWTVEVKRWRLDNPVSKVEIVGAEHIARKAFVARDIKNRILADAPDDDMMFICFCGFDAGMRRDEISEARADWFTGSVHVQRSIGRRLRDKEREWRPKYNKERVIPLTDPFRAFLKRYLRDRAPLDFALHPEIGQGESRYRYDFRYPFADYMRLFHGLPWVTPHVMRHSFASNLKTAGVSIAKIAEWLGDSERVTERTYAWLKPDDREIHVLT